MPDNSLSIVIPNRSRDLALVQRSLSSLHAQLDEKVEVYVIDYGSPIQYQKQLKRLMQEFSGMTLECFAVQGQLWNKSRCINYVLKNANSSHLMVCDMDMIWHPAGLHKVINNLGDEVTYYPVGILTEKETLANQPFLDTPVKFVTNHEATGISVFPIKVLYEINGFDEFYHGWGAEDTDAHLRCKNAGYQVRFRESEVLFKHQWHEKTYRSKESKQPYHKGLERINHSYFSISKKTKKVKANLGQAWGKNLKITAYKKLDHPDQTIELYATHEELSGCFNFLKEFDKDLTAHIQIKEHPKKKSIKTLIKKSSGKKVPRFLTLEQTNEFILENIIATHRNLAYKYAFNRKIGLINLVIHLNRES